MDKALVVSPTGITFAGTPEEQELAACAHDFMRRQGLMFGTDSPITTAIERLVSGVSRAYPGLDAALLTIRLEAALAANSTVFARQEAGGKVVYVTTKSGRHPFVDDQARHMLRQRLNSDATPISSQESRSLTDNWVARAAARAENFTIFVEPSVEPAPGTVRPPVRPGAPAYTPTPQILPGMRTIPTVAVPPEAAPPTLRPVLPPAIEEVPVELEAPPVEVPSEVPAALEPAAVEELPVLPAEVPAEPVPVAVTPPPEPIVAPAPPTPPAAPSVVAVRPIRYVLATPAGPQTIDLSRPVDELLAEHGPALIAMVEQALHEDFRFVTFGPDWFIEDQVERFSKGDFRRFKDYLVETQDALSDHTFMTDVLNRRENDPDFERLRFSLNYRMLREKRDFEFVGVARDRLWIAANNSPVNAPKRKPSELGQDYKYLEEPATQALEPDHDAPPPARLEHVLTYYEYEGGLLPYDQAAKGFFPRPLLEDQRAVILRFEVPALFQTYSVELRFATGNRGGYIVGLDAFFQENLVPGARFTIDRTDQEDVFSLRYERTPAQEARLLHYDERRSRFVFQPTTYYVQVEHAAVLSEERFPRLNNLKRLDEAERKKTEQIVISAFELAGERLDATGRLWATMDDLLPITNLERPFSLGALRSVLEAGHEYLYPDPDAPGAYYYDPAKKVSRES